MNPLSKIVTILLAVILLFIFPIKDRYERTVKEVNNYINNVTFHFVKDIESKGYIDKKMYDDFLSNISKTNNRYDIQIIHTRKVYYPLEETDPRYSTSKTFIDLNDKYGIRQILNVLSDPSKGIYKMSVGDEIEIIVKNDLNFSLAPFESIAEGEFIFARYGGFIENEIK